MPGSNVSSCNQQFRNDGKMFLLRKVEFHPPPIRFILERIRGVTGKEVAVHIIVSYFYHFLTTFIQVEQKVVLLSEPRLGSGVLRRQSSNPSMLHFFPQPSSRRQCLNDQHNEKYKRNVHFTKLASGGRLE